MPKPVMELSRSRMAYSDLRDALRGVHDPAERAYIIAWNRCLGRAMREDSETTVTYLRRRGFRPNEPVLQTDGASGYGSASATAGKSDLLRLQIERKQKILDMELSPLRAMKAEDLQRYEREMRPIPGTLVQMITRAIWHALIVAEMKRRYIPIDGDLPIRRRPRSKPEADEKPVYDPTVMGTLGNDDVALDSYRKANTMRFMRRVPGLYPGQRTIERVVEQEMRRDHAERMLSGDQNTKLIVMRRTA